MKYLEIRSFAISYHSKITNPILKSLLACCVQLRLLLTQFLLWIFYLHNAKESKITGNKLSWQLYFLQLGCLISMRHSRYRLMLGIICLHTNLWSTFACLFRPSLHWNSVFSFEKYGKNKKCFSALCCASVTLGFCCIWSGWMLIGWMAVV